MMGCHVLRDVSSSKPPIECLFDSDQLQVCRVKADNSFLFKFITLDGSMVLVNLDRSASANMEEILLQWVREQNDSMVAGEGAESAASA